MGEKKSFKVRADFIPEEQMKKIKEKNYESLPEVVTYGLVKKAGFWSVIKMISKGYVVNEVEVYQEDLKHVALAKLSELVESETEWGKV